MIKQTKFYCWVLFFVIISSCGEGFDSPYKNVYTPFCQCEYERESQTLKLGTPDENEVKILHKLIEVNSLPSGSYPYKLCKSKVSIEGATAFATQFNGYPYIIYDPDKMHGSYRSEFVMAHELAHLIAWHVSPGDQKKKELEADEMAGAMLFKLGVSLQDALNTQSENTEARDPHSSGIDRRAAIKRGWLRTQSRYSGQPEEFKILATQPLKKSRTQIGGKRYRTIISGNREIMAEDLRYKIGNSAGIYYSINDANKACLANGWELMAHSDFWSIISRYAYDQYEERGFNPIRAYGALLENGDSGFNAKLTGYSKIDSEGKQKYYERGKSSNYWIQDKSNDGYPFYFKFDRESGELVCYWTKNPQMYSCRCARDVN